MRTCNLCNCHFGVGAPGYTDSPHSPDGWICEACHKHREQTRKENLYLVTEMDKFTIKHADHFYISVHGVEGIRLRVDSPTIGRLKLKTKLLELCDGINRYL